MCLVPPCVRCLSPDPSQFSLADTVIIILLLQVRTWKHREVMSLAQRYTASQFRAKPWTPEPTLKIVGGFRGAHMRSP